MLTTFGESKGALTIKIPSKKPLSNAEITKKDKFSPSPIHRDVTALRCNLCRQQTAYNRWYAMAVSKNKNEYLLEKEANARQIEILREKIRKINEQGKLSNDEEQKEALRATLAATASELQSMIAKQEKSGKDLSSQQRSKSYSYASGILNDDTLGVTEKTRLLLDGADEKARSLYSKIYQEEAKRIGTYDKNGKMWAQSSTLERFAKALEKQNRAVQRKEELVELRKLNQTLGNGTTVIWTLPNS